MPSRRIGPAATIVAALILTLVPAGAAQAATITACVKRTTGAATILTGKKAKKKCPKGSSKVRWSTTGVAGKRGLTGPAGIPGAAGPAGPVGPLLYVRDRNGAAVGQFMGLLPAPVPYLAVLKDGGLYYYVGSGEVLPLQSPKFKTNTCTLSAAYVDTSSPVTVALYTALVGGPTRIVYRKTNPAFGPTAAWKITAATEDVAVTQLYDLQSDGSCAADGGPYTGTLVKLEQVSAPADALGPLTISS